MQHLKTKKLKVIEHTKSLVKMNKVLTDDKVALVVHTCKELSVMGLGIDKNTCLQVVNTILSERIDVKDFQEVTAGVVTHLLRDNADLLCIAKGNSIDTKCVQQANEDVRNALFLSLIALSSF